MQNFPNISLDNLLFGISDCGIRERRESQFLARISFGFLVANVLGISLYREFFSLHTHLYLMALCGTVPGLAAYLLARMARIRTSSILFSLNIVLLGLLILYYHPEDRPVYLFLLLPIVITAHTFSVRIAAYLTAVIFILLIFVSYHHGGNGSFDPMIVLGTGAYALTSMLIILFIAHRMGRERSQEEATRSEEERYKTVVDNVVDGIITADRDMNIRSYNFAAEKIFGYKADEVMGKNVRLLMSTSDSTRHDGHVDSYHRTGEAKIIGVGREVIGRRKDATEFPAELAISQTGESFNRMYIAIIRDITRRRKMEENLYEARVAAEEASETKSRFLAIMSHEIRTPLNGILGMMDLLSITNLEHDQRTYLEHAQSSSKLLLRLLSDILDFSSMEAGKLSIEKNTFSLFSLSDNVVTMGRLNAAEKGLDFHFRVGEDLPSYVQGDRGRLHQVLSNLIYNAIKFTQEGFVSLRISLARDAKIAAASEEVRILFEVEDSGVGLEDEFADTIFEEFVQVDHSSTREHGGVGLGLAICKGYVEAMDGKIGYKHSAQGGSIFWFELPFLPMPTDHLKIKAHYDKKVKEMEK